MASLAHDYRGGGFCLAVICLSLLAGCGPSPDTVNLGIELRQQPEWEIYYRSSDTIRLRKKSSEAIIDLSTIRLGPKSPYADFTSFYRQHAHVSLPSTVDAESNIVIDKARGKLIVFSGRRADTGVATAGMRYLLELNGQAYAFIFLDAGSKIEAHRQEARTLIESIQFAY